MVSLLFLLAFWIPTKKSNCNLALFCLKKTYIYVMYICNVSPLFGILQINGRKSQMYVNGGNKLLLFCSKGGMK